MTFVSFKTAYPREWRQFISKKKQSNSTSTDIYTKAEKNLHKTFFSIFSSGKSATYFYIDSFPSSS